MKMENPKLHAAAESHPNTTLGTGNRQGLDRQMSTRAIEVYAEMANHLPDMAQLDLVKFWKRPIHPAAVRDNPTVSSEADCVTTGAFF
jgi:hypothetical protein